MPCSRTTYCSSWNRQDQHKRGSRGRFQARSLPLFSKLAGRHPDRSVPSGRMTSGNLSFEVWVEHSQ